MPVNRPHAPVDDMLRDGQHQHEVHSGVTAFKPNTLGGSTSSAEGLPARRDHHRRPDPAGHRGPRR
nr:hypothetical protein [Actinokineospora globicatena]